MNRNQSVILLLFLFAVSTLAKSAGNSPVTSPSRPTQASESITALPGSAPLIAELETSLDSKKAKVGDRVSAHTTEALKANGKILVPKNAKLLGHITQSSARAKGDPSSTLAIQFDKAILKKGEEIPVKLLIQAIAAAPRVTMEATPDLNAMPSGTAAAQGSPMGPSRQASPTIPQGSTRPEANGSSSPSSDRSADSSNAGVDGLDSAGRLTPKSHGVIGLEGIHLATDATSFEQGSLITSSAKSLRLDEGVRILLISQ